MRPILELIFLTLIEKSFVVTNDSQAAAQHGTKTTPIFLPADGEAS